MTRLTLPAAVLLALTCAACHSEQTRNKIENMDSHEPVQANGIADDEAERNAAE